jgi:hypothetical protein
MDRKAVAEAWTEGNKKSQSKDQLLREQEAMKAEFRAESRLGSALFTTLKSKGQSHVNKEHKAFGFDSRTTTKSFAIGLGSVTHEGVEICMQATLSETHQSGQDAGGAPHRDISFQAGLIGEELATVPGGNFSAYLSPVYDHLIESRLQDMRTLNQQMRDVAEIIGVEIPTAESLVQAA